jgi:hypothetical protein
MTGFETRRIRQSQTPAAAAKATRDRAFVDACEAWLRNAETGGTAPQHLLAGIAWRRDIRIAQAAYLAALGQDR